MISKIKGLFSYLMSLITINVCIFLSPFPPLVCDVFTKKIYETNLKDAEITIVVKNKNCQTNIKVFVMQAKYFKSNLKQNRINLPIRLIFHIIAKTNKCN